MLRRERGNSMTHLLRIVAISAALVTLSSLPAALASENPDNEGLESLENTSWQLLVIHAAADTEFTPDSPANYVLRFRSGGRLQIEADCNQAGATWELRGVELILTDLVSTRKLCPQPSLFNRYLMNLERANRISLTDGRLTLHTTSESDRMEFEPYVFTPGG